MTPWLYTRILIAAVFAVIDTCAGYILPAIMIVWFLDLVCNGIVFLVTDHFKEPLFSGYVVDLMLICFASMKLNNLLFYTMSDEKVAIVAARILKRMQYVKTTPPRKRALLVKNKKTREVEVVNYDMPWVTTGRLDMKLYVFFHSEPLETIADGVRLFRVPTKKKQVAWHLNKAGKVCLLSPWKLFFNKTPETLYWFSPFSHGAPKMNKRPDKVNWRGFVGDNAYYAVF